LRNKAFLFKIIFTYFFVLIIVSFFLFFIFSSKIKDAFIEDSKQEIKKYSIIINENLNFLLQKEKYPSLDDYIINIGKKTGLRITLIDTTGFVISDSYEKAQYMANHLNRYEVGEALKGNESFDIRTSETLRQKMIYFAIPVKKDDKIIGVLRVSKLIEEINRELNFFVFRFFLIFILIVIISLIFIFLIYYNFNKAINKFSRIAKKVAQGNFDVKFVFDSDNEIEDLGRIFNYVIEKVQDLFYELSNEKEELKSILSSIKEGILVINKEGKIIRSNNSFKLIVKNLDVVNKYHWEILRNSSFTELLKSLDGENKNIVREISLNEKIYLCSINFLSLKEEFVLIFYDITELKEFEKIKKEFVANVSHELGTPLTAIKGFIETLYEDEKDSEKKHYLQIIKNNTERLINIVKDLLLLSNIEEKKLSNGLTQVDLKEVVNTVVSILKEKIEEKNLSLNLNIEENIPSIKGDRFKLEQMLINLVDNAIKYTDSGNITLNLEKNNNFLEINIEDTGIGIPEKDISRIFERFYVIDKSRSRKSGGTGLGLSIVKHIVLLHKGQINVTSKVGSGTKFSIRLPIN